LLLHELLAAIHAKLAAVHTCGGVRLFTALLERNPLVDDLAAVGTKADWRMGVSVIEIGAWFVMHFSPPQA
jgi:hypothetical protein